MFELWQLLEVTSLKMQYILGILHMHFELCWFDTGGICLYPSTILHKLFRLTQWHKSSGRKINQSIEATKKWQKHNLKEIDSCIVPAVRELVKRTATEDLEEFCQILIKISVRLSNKANLRDLIAATGLVIWFKFDPIDRFFSLCDLEIWCMTLKNNTTPLLYYIKLCVSFQIHRWIQTKVTVRKRSILVKIGDYLSCVTLKFDGWPWKTIGHLFYTTSSFMHHFIPIGDFKFQFQSGNAQFGSKSTIFWAVWPRNFTDDPPKQ